MMMGGKAPPSDRQRTWTKHVALPDTPYAAAMAAPG